MSNQVTLHGPGALEYIIDFDYQPYEPPERGPEAQYPGCAESVEINDVTLNGHCVTSMLTDAQLQALAELVLEHIHEMIGEHGHIIDLEPLSAADYDLPY